MATFSKTSLDRLATCHPDLQRLFNEVVKHYDCAILCGHRTQEEQDKAVEGGFSKTPFPTSKHNKSPSLAIDAAPYPIDWNNRERFVHFAGFVQGMAKSLGIKIRWGGDFNQDLNFKNDSFFDAPHFELME